MSLSEEFAPVAETLAADVDLGRGKGASIRPARCRTAEVVRAKFGVGVEPSLEDIETGDVTPVGAGGLDVAARAAAAANDAAGGGVGGGGGLFNELARCEGTDLAAAVETDAV
jgi:hypothetical protein